MRLYISALPTGVTRFCPKQKIRIFKVSIDVINDSKVLAIPHTSLEKARFTFDLVIFVTKIYLQVIPDLVTRIH